MYNTKYPLPIGVVLRYTTAMVFMPGNYFSGRMKVMYKLGQIMLIAGVLIMLTISILLLIGVIDGKIAGGLIVFSLILAGGGSALSRKNRK